MQEITIPLGQSPKQSVWDDYVPIITNGRHTDVYLTDNIEAPSEYNKMCHLLSHAYPEDTFTLHINNGGGYVDSGFMLINAIKNSKAKVHAKLSGTVASVATIITLSCNTIEVADYLQFMIHNYSSSGGGNSKGHELRAMVDFTDTELNKAFSEVYGKFLTPHEMELVIAGKDLWMGKDELLARWKARELGDIESLEEIAANRKGK